MKNFKQRIVPVVASSLMVMALLVSPFVSSANADKNDKNGNGKITARANAQVESHRENHSNIFSRFLSTFGGKYALAANTNNSASLTPRISGITSPTVLKVGEVGTWSVSASDPKDGSLTYSVDWGDTAGISPLARMAEQPFVQTSTFTHAYATVGTYTIKFTVSNSTGQTTSSSVTVRIGGTSVAAPVISDLTATSTKARQATLSWMTDLRSSSMVWYSTTSPVVTSGKANLSRSVKIKNHKMLLTKLEPNTKYYVVVGSAIRGSTTLSSEISFITPALSSDMPVITSLTGSKTVIAGATETVTVNAYDPKNGSLTYSADWGDTMMVKGLLSVQEPVFIQSATFEHVYTTPGTYTATFTTQNTAGQKTTSSMSIVVTAANSDTVAPVISAHDPITAVATSADGALVTYTLPTVTDNVDATSNATCLPASGSMFAIGNTTALCNATDASGNKATQTSFTVTVTADTTDPIISGIATTASSTGGTIAWTTDEPTTSEVFYSTSTPVNVNSDATLSVLDKTLTKNHSLVIPALTSNTLYHFVIQSNDGSGNASLSSEGTFTTSL